MHSHLPVRLVKGKSFDLATKHIPEVHDKQRWQSKIDENNQRYGREKGRPQKDGIEVSVDLSQFEAKLLKI